MKYFLCSVKLNFEGIKKADLPNNAAKALWRKIKRKDGGDWKECVVNPYFDVINISDRGFIAVRL